jgi:SAM-dependent methyltransferase
MSFSSSIKIGLKPILVPCWNAAYRSSALALDYLRAVGSGRVERCAVCGRFRPMFYRRGIIPRRLEELWGLTPQLAEAFARKETCACSHCGARLRGRRLAQVMLDLYPVGNPPAPARSLADWTNAPESQALRIAEINRIDGLHEYLAQMPHFASSDYDASSSHESMQPAVRSEDLTRLTYADEFFDLILTSESLEHVPVLDRALREIHRVLVPGGRHVFTVPLLPGVAKTFARSVRNADGTIEDRAPRICHPGGDWGYPVFTEFGADLSELLDRAGFDTDIHFGPPRGDDVAQVFACRKRPAAGSTTLEPDPTGIPGVKR